MHEAVLFRDLREKLVELASNHPQERIVRVRVRVGALSHVDPPSLHGAWKGIVQGTPAEGAALITLNTLDLSSPDVHQVILESVDLEPEGDAVQPRSV